MDSRRSEIVPEMNLMDFLYFDIFEVPPWYQEVKVSAW